MLNPATSLPPGFRFHPTDEELILHYLRNRAASLPCPVSIIAEVDIYKFDPWELPAQSLFGEREWYFFSPRERKYPNGARPNRAAASGYWKATGTDKSIVATGGTSRENIGVKKALVFYKGRPPKGVKTDWIMHEYRLGQAHRSNLYRPMNLKDSSMRLDDWVLCRIYRKSSHHAPGDAEQDSSADDGAPVATPSSNARAAPGGDAFLKLPNSCSLTELVETVDCSPLARLFDNPPDMTGVLEIFPAPASYPSMNQPFCSINGENSYSAPQPTTQTEPPVLIADIGALKRHRPAESGDPSSPSKRPTDSSTPTNNYFANKIDGRGAQLDLTSHPFFNHLQVMNAHLGSQ